MDSLLAYSHDPESASSELAWSALALMMQVEPVLENLEETPSATAPTKCMPMLNSHAERTYGNES
jgi:hypothetical protein